MKLYSILFSMAFIAHLHSVGQVNNKWKQPILGSRTAKIIKVEGFSFKDLNKNGKLDKYEDWRLSSETRSKDLLSKMSLEQKVGFMLISTTRLNNDWSFETPKNSDPITSDFNETDLVQDINMFSKKPLPVPIMSSAGTTRGITQFHLRHFIFRANTTARITAEWANKLQAACESDGLGIPAIVASNPRNHITRDASIGLSVGKTVFSTWPGELGLSATRDLALVHTFADMARQEWASVGLRKGYMYMADISTEPRWQRIEGTFGEDAEWAGKMMYEIVTGFQGKKLSNNSVALTTKHFPGGGATEGGQDPHFEWGKNEVFPGGMFNNNLVPFKAAIKAGTSAIMPYYSIPNNTPYEKVAYAYNKQVLQGLLRGTLGFKGIINSDTGPIEMMPWGAENLSVKERYKKTLEAGVNLYSGTADPTLLLETAREGLVDQKLIDSSVSRLLMEKFDLGLFENPYVDVDAAEKLVGNANFQAKADEAFRKSIVLLRNKSNALPLRANTKVYFESYYKRRGAPTASIIYKPVDNKYPVQFVATPGEADVIILWITPGAKSLFESDGSPLYLSLSKNNVDVAYVNELTAKKPTILLINYTNPWVIDEIYNDKSNGNVHAVLATFGTTTDAVLDIVTGKFKPTGKMPFTTPVSEKAAQNQKPDVPGYLKGSDYPLFKYNEGVTYK
ncbi:MAG TPA: glycoside hydrolase family 3 N-terminal domain-containing protein [Chitinophagaceae bacterium]|nr:glycoside hydrolase family 3 N-terminal domain-containing protein [Chitinophagaceae bacterium]